MRKWKRWIVSLACAALAALLVLGVELALRQQREAAREIPPLEELISNYDDVIASIRQGLRNHSEQITVRFRYSQNILDQLNDAVADWMDEALAETDSPVEGDYLRYQYAGYKIVNSYERHGGAYDYAVAIRPQHYIYLHDEQEADAAVAALLEQFAFSEDTTDLEKIRTIYDYVCTHVEYNNFRRRSPHYYPENTCYFALIRGRASCQGYAVTLYRLLRSVGVDCRVVTGTGYYDGGSEFHAWNLVRLDGQYYMLDATWDAGKDAYHYFLRGTEGLYDHVLGDEFLTEEFQTQYPMAEQDFAV